MVDADVEKRDLHDDPDDGLPTNARELMAAAAEAALQPPEPGQPIGPVRFPVALVSLARVDRLRDARCAIYDDCLHLAARWPGWICVGCPRFTPLPPDERETDECPVDL